MFEAGVISAATAGAMQEIGATNWGIGYKVAASAAVGGLSSVARGGNFQSGFLAAGFSSFAGAEIPSAGPVGNVVIGAAIGGTASVIGGGKFENGAVTGAFAYVIGQINNGAPNQNPSGGSASAPGVQVACLEDACIGEAAAVITVGEAVASTAAGVAIGASITSAWDWLKTTISAIIAGPYDQPVIVGDLKGNNIPLAPGDTLQGSPDGSFVQVKGPDNGSSTTRSRTWRDPT